jgi:predicted chitinase
MDATFPLLDYPSGTKAKDISEAIEKALYTNAESESTGGSYPIGQNHFWHGGVHLTTSDQPVRAIADGVVVAYRINDSPRDYEVVESAPAEGEGKEKKEKPKEVYSNGFVLIKHKIVTPKGKEISFYSLYMHLKPMTQAQTEEEWDPLKSPHIFKKTHYFAANDDSGGGMPVVDADVLESLGVIPFQSHFKVHPNDDKCKNHRFRHIRLINKKIDGYILVSEAQLKNVMPKLRDSKGNVHPKQGRIIDAEAAILDASEKETGKKLPKNACFMLQPVPDNLKRKRYTSVVYFPQPKRLGYIADPGKTSKVVAGVYHQSTSEQTLQDPDNGGNIDTIPADGYFSIPAQPSVGKDHWTLTSENKKKKYQFAEYRPGAVAGFSMIAAVKNPTVSKTEKGETLAVLGEDGKSVGTIAEKEEYLALAGQPPAASILFNLRYFKFSYPDPAAAGGITGYAFLREGYDVTHLEKTVSDKGSLWIWGHEDMTCIWPNEIRDDSEQEIGDLNEYDVFELLDDAAVPAGHWSRSTGWRNVSYESEARQNQAKVTISGDHHYAWVGPHVKTVPDGASPTPDKEQTYYLSSLSDFNKLAVRHPAIQPPNNANYRYREKAGYQNLLETEKKTDEATRPWDGRYNGITVREKANVDSRVIAILDLGTTLKLKNDVPFGVKQKGGSYEYAVTGKADWKELSDGGFVWVDGRDVSKRSELPKPIQFNRVVPLNPPVPVRRGDIVGFGGQYRHVKDLIHFETFLADHGFTKDTEDRWGPYVVRIDPGAKLYLRTKMTPDASKTLTLPANTSVAIEERDCSERVKGIGPVYCKVRVLAIEGWVAVGDLNLDAADDTKATLKKDLSKLFNTIKHEDRTVTETTTGPDGKTKTEKKKVKVKVIDDKKGFRVFPGKGAQAVTITEPSEPHDETRKIKYAIDEGKGGWVNEPSVKGTDPAHEPKELDQSIPGYRYYLGANLTAVPDDPAKAFSFEAVKDEKKSTELRKELKGPCREVEDEDKKKWLQAESTTVEDFEGLDGKQWIGVRTGAKSQTWFAKSDSERVYKYYRWLDWTYEAEEKKKDDPKTKVDESKFSEDGFCDVQYLLDKFEKPDAKKLAEIHREMRHFAVKHPTEWDYQTDKNIDKWERLAGAPWKMKAPGKDSEEWTPQYNQLMEHIKGLQFWDDVPDLPAASQVWHFHPIGFIAHLRLLAGLSEDTLVAICGEGMRKNIHEHLDFFNDALDKYEVNSGIRQAHLLAQMGAEVLFFVFNEEQDPKHRGQPHNGLRYEGRGDLGNVFPGDGPAFIGRGFLQITGRNRYESYGNYLGMDFSSSPAKARQVKEKEHASDVAGWFWTAHNPHKIDLNKVADNTAAQADYKVVRKITHEVNGGVNHMGRRVQFFKRARWYLCRDIDFFY